MSHAAAQRSFIDQPTTVAQKKQMILAFQFRFPALFPRQGNLKAINDCPHHRRLRILLNPLEAQ
jgi:hypothetical protein